MEDTCDKFEAFSDEQHIEACMMCKKKGVPEQVVIQSAVYAQQRSKIINRTYAVCKSNRCEKEWKKLQRAIVSGDIGRHCPNCLAGEIKFNAYRLN